MKEVIEFILQNALPENTEFSVAQTENEEGITFSLSIPAELRGRIIGRGGRNIKAIRDVINIIARKQNRRVFIKITD
jgi:predicted RNA-binding protein YlqC (UPF0109 family)